MSTTRLFVGNLSYNTGSDSLRAAFSAHGAVSSATVPMDRESGQSRGFGFVEFGSAAEAHKAIEAMNGATIDGRTIMVNAARDRDVRAPGGGGGSGGGGPRGGGERSAPDGERRGGRDRR